MAKSFEILRAKMSPEARARAHEMALKDLAEIGRQDRDDPSFVAESLKNAVESGDPRAIATALGRVADFHADKLDHNHHEFLERALWQSGAGEEVDSSEVMKVVEQLHRAPRR